MNPRTLIAGTALAVAAAGTPAHALCCDSVLDIYVVHGAASVSTTGHANDVPSDYDHDYQTSCAYSTSADQASAGTSDTGVLAVAVRAAANPRYGVWDISARATCTLYTTTGAVYSVHASGSRLSFVQVEAAQAVRVPGGLPVQKICVYTHADWYNPATHSSDQADSLDDVCSYPGVHFKAADEDIRVASPL